MIGKGALFGSAQSRGWLRGYHLNASAMYSISKSSVLCKLKERMVFSMLPPNLLTKEGPRIVPWTRGWESQVEKEADRR